MLAALQAGFQASLARLSKPLQRILDRWRYPDARRIPRRFRFKARPQRVQTDAEADREEHGRFIAQEVIALSRHPTAIGERLEPRHVDLRVFAVTVGDRPTVLPAPLTRVSFAADSLVVNSSKGEGKDTWVPG